MITAMKALLMAGKLLICFATVLILVCLAASKYPCATESAKSGAMDIAIVCLGAVIAIAVTVSVIERIERSVASSRKPAYDRSRIARVIAFAADEMKVDLPTGLAQHAANLVLDELCKPGSVLVEETHS